MAGRGISWEQEQLLEMLVKRGDWTPIYDLLAYAPYHPDCKGKEDYRPNHSKTTQGLKSLKRALKSLERREMVELRVEYGEGRHYWQQHTEALITKRGRLELKSRQAA